MSKKKSLIIIFSSLVILISIILIYSILNSNDPITISPKSVLKVIDVDEVVEKPEKFSGPISVEGIVKEIADDKKFFTLGCEDACVNLPVSYKGELPKLESNIIALGEVKKDIDGKFFFDAHEIKYK